MTSAAFGQAVAGAAQGSYFGPVGMVIGGIAGFISGSSADTQFANQTAWANYNNLSQYNTNIFNIGMSLAIANISAQGARRAAQANPINSLRNE